MDTQESKLIPEYLEASSFAMKFEGDAEVSGQLIDLLLRKHYTELSKQDILQFFPHKEDETVVNALDEFVTAEIVTEIDEDTYALNTDNTIVQGLREEQLESLQQ